MAEHPNDASRKSKAEGERDPRASRRATSDSQSTDERSGGITNRSDGRRDVEPAGSALPRAGEVRAP